MKKIYLIRANKTKFGGAENYLGRLYEELLSKNINIVMINSIFPKFLPSWIRALLFNLQACIFKKDKFYFSLERITCPDIYRAGDGVHKVYMDISGRKKERLLDKIYLHIEKNMFETSKKVIAISNMVKNDIISTYHINPDKIKVIYNGIKLQKYDYKSSCHKISKEFDIKPNTPIFLFVGSGFERKGVKEFLYILSKLPNQNYQAFIVGKEKKMAFYKKLAMDLNISDKVIFTGPRTDVKDFYTISDIFLFPTKYEPFGNVILEAMNFKNAVITTKYCGGGEILDSQFIMKSSNDFSIIDKIDKLINNKEKLELEKERNYQIVQNFTIEKNAKETMKVINEYLH